MKRMIDELESLPKSPHDDAQDAAALAIPPMAGIIGAAAAVHKYQKEFEMQPVLDGPLPKFCIAHHCTERGPKCDKCAYTAFSSSHRRRLEA